MSRHYPSRGLAEEHPGLLELALRTWDLLWIVLAGLIAHWIVGGFWLPETNQQVTLVLAVLLASLLFPAFHLYRPWRGVRLLVELRTILLAWASVLIGLSVIGAILDQTAAVERRWWLTWFVLQLLVLFGTRVALRSGLRLARSRGLNARRIVLIGGGRLAARVWEQLRDTPSAGLQVEGYFDEEDYDLPLAQAGLPRLGGYSDIARHVERERIHQVWLALPLQAEDRLRRVLHDLRHSTADIRFVPDIFGFQLLNHSISEVAGVPVLNLRTSPLVGINRVIKEVEDRVLALIILALISPLMLAIAVGVKLSSPGPILFKQKRHGWDGRPITVFKFRSMRVHHEKPGMVTQASRDDDRITPFGGFLRRTSLDELPQFINVLRGEMSIVGPRPHAVEHNEQFKEQVDRYMLRHKVKPGITGWAQVNGYRGETDTLFKMKKRVEHDLYYIEHWSLWFDLKIIVLTLFKGFSNPNAY